jgi:thioredoxin-related protein
MFLPLLSLCQENKGIHFDNQAGWSEILTAAKTQNKYILVDCYATWCGPCKWMKKNIFPVATVGDSVNKYFISVEVQMDTTKTDNDRIKNWYSDARDIQQKYQVNAFPTFLYFNPQGKLVHRSVGAADSPESFISEVKRSTDPATQYYTMLEKYQLGNRDSSFLVSLAEDAYPIDRNLAAEIGDDLTTALKDPFNKNNLELIGRLMLSSGSRAFSLYFDQTARIDSVMGNDYAERKMMNIMMADDDYIRATNAATINPDWNKLYNGVREKFGNYYADRITKWVRLNYFKNKKDWKNYNRSVIDYVVFYKSTIGFNQLNSFAWDIFTYGTETNDLTVAADWSKETLESKDGNTYSYYDTYANLLFKLDQKQDAIEAEKKAVAMAPEDQKKEFRDNLQKMQKSK